MPNKTQPNKSSSSQPDTASSRRKRLQERLRELTEQGDKELASVMDMLEKTKLAFRSKKK